MSSCFLPTWDMQTFCLASCSRSLRLCPDLHCVHAHATGLPGNTFCRINQMTLDLRENIIILGSHRGKTISKQSKTEYLLSGSLLTTISSLAQSADTLTPWQPPSARSKSAFSSSFMCVSSLTSRLLV